MVKAITLGLAVITAMIAMSASRGAAAQGLAPALIACRGIGDEADRLACFDGVASGLDADAPVAASVVAGDPALSAQEQFGIEDLVSTKERKKRENRKAVLSARIVDIARNKRGKYVVILDNGQVWRQINADTDKLRVPKNVTGLGVEVKRKALGAHLLKLDNGNRTIRVERIK